MNKKAFEKKDSCCDQQRLDEEIRDLMTSLEKQNALLSGYYEKVTKNSLQKVHKRLRIETDQL